MRIGLFSDTYTPEINGVVSSIVTLQQGLESMGHEVYIITTHPSLVKLSYEDHVLRLPGIELKKMYGYVLTSPIHIRAHQMVKDMNLDIIHAHTEFGIGIFARIMSHMLVLPLVITYHTTYEDYTHYVNVFNSKQFEKVARKTVSKLSQVYINTSDAIISPSEKTKNMLLGYGVKKDIHVVPTGLDLDRFNPKHSTSHQISELKQELKIASDEKVILYVGRIAKEKSIDLIIKGFNEINQENLKIHLVIVGAGPELEELKQLASTMKQATKIHFVGKKLPTQVPLYYHMCDVFASASLTETQGMTFVEAFASHTPVFAREDDVLKELIKENETGYYFESAESFAFKIENYFKLSVSEQHKIQEKTSIMAQPYDRPYFINAVLSIYQQAILDVKESMILDTVQHVDDVVECHFVNRKRELNVFVSKSLFVYKGLRKGNLVDKETITELLDNDQYTQAYQKCIRKLAVKDRSVKEMYDFLTEKSTLSIAQINQLIKQLEEKGYLNDKDLALSMVNSYRSLLQGRHKVIRNLRKKGIPQKIIDNVLNENILEDEVERAIQWANKVKPSLKDKSVREIKQNLVQKLIAQGYDYSVTEMVMNSLNFADEEQSELDNLRRAAQKAYKRYILKHNGTALRNAIFTYLDHKGYALEDIYIVLNEMEF